MIHRWLARVAGTVSLAIAIALPAGAAPAKPEIRIGVLQYGTVNWELEAMQRLGLAEQEGLQLTIVPLALKDAASVALLGSAVDVIVTDWLWVARQRADGRDYVFAPYSRTVGNVMARRDSGVSRLADLKGKKLGIAGGPLDKSWLLLRAYARKTLGEDAASLVEPTFAAPPLLNQLVLKGELPAALNFWHYAARLEAAGMRRILDMDEILAALGIDHDLPLLGWVFRQGWADSHRASVDAFLRASAATKRRLATDDGLWETLRPSTRAEDDATLRALRDGYRAGIPPAGGLGDTAAAERAARQAFAILAREGGEAVTGPMVELPSGLFWKAAGQ